MWYMDLLLSIIIPCYNAGNFMQQTIDMLARENLDHCEIVFIDDGSKDDTLSIIKQNINRFQNIRYITRENRGVSASRNEGISKAQGKYIYFLDSDDEVTDGSIQYFKEKILANRDCDLISFAYKMIDTNGHETYYVNHRLNEKKFKNEQCADLFYRGLLFLHICSVIINRAFLVEKNIAFTEGVKIGEDFDFLRRVSLQANTSVYYDRICFVYKLRMGSATNGLKYFGNDAYTAALNSFNGADDAEGILDKKTINYYLAARYSSSYLKYLKSSQKSNEYNQFFLYNRECLYKKMNKGRPKVMLAISFLRVFPVSFALKVLKT